MNKQTLIKQLELIQHPREGGYFNRTYESTLTLSNNQTAASCIYYLLTDDEPIGYMHRNKSDIIHYHHCGGAIRYTVISDSGNMQQYILGCDIENQQQPQLLIKGGDWKYSELIAGDFGLLSEIVIPAFEYKDNEIMTLEKAQQQFPQQLNAIKNYIKD